ncbi:outer membrane protein OprF [Alcanivorax xiamenensis]|uniref:Outer membrane protein OprF n=1 Tax=Alcanivorax xiamenensis TaxID=1177156 RepID=A0ABQ6YBP6_9GAMM|nr:OmpA family protein [Alcanivorax xiamenensis]KAF0807050.1 outer membrane protein OprF [Alcanivorax xiamenensis]
MDAKRFLASSIALASVSVASVATAADIPDRYFYLGGHVSQSWMDIGDHYEGDGYIDDNVPGVTTDTVTLPGAQLGYRFNRDWSIQAWWERNNYNSVDLRNNFVSLRKHFRGDASPFETYVGLNAGETRTEFNSESSNDFKEAVGGVEFGVQTALARNFLLDVGARPTYSFRSERWDGQVYAGLNLLIGASSAAKPAPVTDVATDSDGDGVPDDRDQCPNTPAGAVVDARGCELDDDGDGVPNSADQCPNTPAGAKVDEVGCQLYLTEDIKETLYVEFEFDKAVVRQTSYPELEGLATRMREYPSANLVLEGHTDSTGPEGYNQKLSQQRANAVKDVLVDHFNVDTSRISVEGYGEAKPIADNSTREGRAQNRRVEAIMKATVKEAQFQD